MKDIVTPVPPEEVRTMIKKCLETAALVNYTRLSAEARIEGELFLCYIFHFIISIIYTYIIFTFHTIIFLKRW